MTLNNLDIKVSGFLQHLTHNFQWIGSSMRFFKNASKTKYKGRKKGMCHLERARPKNVRPFIQEKSGGRVQKKINLLISDAPEIKWVSYLCFHSEHTDASLNVTQCA